MALLGMTVPHANTRASAAGTGHRPRRRQQAGSTGVQVAGHADQPPGVREHVVRTGILQQHGHPGAQQGRVRAWAGPFHGADDIAGQGAGHRAEPDRVRRGLPADLHIDVVRTDGLGPDQHLAGTWLGDGGLLDLG